ncbi:uncharacterized protein [Ptychodera flava]|uniref:uncharacterized protein n=1 Tax=Ptychodera flava TaxID=63121 RepID=UPI00396A8ED2
MEPTPSASTAAQNFASEHVQPPVEPATRMQAEQPPSSALPSATAAVPLPSANGATQHVNTPPTVQAVANPVSQVSDRNTLHELQQKVDKLQQAADTANVEEALLKLMDLAHMSASRYQLVNALRVLVDRATIVNHPTLKRYRAVLSQFEGNEFGSDAGKPIVLLLGNKEEEEIASKVGKFLKHTRPSRDYRPYPFSTSTI